MTDVSKLSDEELLQSSARAAGSVDVVLNGEIRRRLSAQAERIAYLETLVERLREIGLQAKDDANARIAELERDENGASRALDHAMVRADAAEKERDEARDALRPPRRPNDEGGPGKEDSYWLQQKLNAAIRHLRDIEDEFRCRRGVPEGFNMIRADRARSIYEQITDDFLNGKRDVLTMKERADAAEARVVVLENALREIARFGASIPAPGWEPVISADAKAIARAALAVRDEETNG